ncbi:Fc receptor-like protein 5 isoform X2 [Hoplias malabaricus]
MAYIRSTEMFVCKLSNSLPPLTFEFLRNGGEVLQTTEDTQGGQPIIFRFRVNERSKGQYSCRVTARGHSSTSNALNFEVMIPVQGTKLVSDPEPPVIYEGAQFTLSCYVRKGSHLSYLWYHNKENVASHSPFHHFSGNTLTVEKASERHAGYYSCLATNKLGNFSTSSSSTEVSVVVKKYLSAPKLSFTLYHHGSGHHANISCRCDSGSPPVTFSLLLDGRNVSVQQTNLLEAWFSLPVIVGLDMGTVQCRAETDNQQLLSSSVDLEVVPVGGSVHIVMEYLQTADSVVAAALLQCIISRGTFPQFSWAFNNSSLPSEGHSHALSPHGNILVLTNVNKANSGHYSCQVRDSFNLNSTWLKSEQVLVKRTAFKLTSIEVIAVAFCCFLLVIVVGGACCLFLSFKKERHQHRGNDRDVDSCEQTNPETVCAMQETESEPQTEVVDTVVMEVEV